MAVLSSKPRNSPNNSCNGSNDANEQINSVSFVQRVIALRCFLCVVGANGIKAAWLWQIDNPFAQIPLISACPKRL